MTMFDLPDWSPGRRVTQLPLIGITQAVNITPYDSGVIDVGQFTHLIVSARSNSNTGVFILTLNFWSDSNKTFPVYTRTVALYGNQVLYTHVFAILARFVEFQISELTATGDTVSLYVVPASGPADKIGTRSLAPTFTEVSIAAGGNVVFFPNLLNHGVYRLRVSSHSPQWQVDVQIANLAGGFGSIFTFTNKTTRLPLDTQIAAAPANYQIKVTNNWAYAALYSAWITFVGELS